MISVKQGVLEAMTPLFDRYHVKLYNFFLRLTFDRVLSEDLTQNVFYRILRYRHSYRKEHKFRSWMYQMARNILADHFEKEKIKPRDQYPEDWLEKHQGNDEEDIENKERLKALYKALFQLPAEQREILELSRFQGLKYKEIAEITGNSVGAIKVKVYRSIQKLRELYFQEV